MKTGLLTFYHIHHYGAALQAAALERAVEQLGGQCEIIDYYVNQNNALFRPPTGPAAAASDVHTALHYPALRRRCQRFQDFQAEHLHITEKRYRSAEKLEQAELPYDVLLCGSDQIWNPTIFPDRRLDPVFFGDFSSLRKIAYAPSFGISQIPEDMREELRTYLAAFSHLSTREPSGQAIIRDLTARNAPVTLDPTLLLTAKEWSELASRPDGYPEGEYLLCYCISRPGALEPYLRAMAEKTGLPIVQLCGVRKKVHPAARCVLDAGPAEFLGLFQNAAAVVTNSFHGTAFSVLFHKPFFTAVSPRELNDPENARTYGLLSRLGLADRVTGTGYTADIGADIDWDGAERALRTARADSLGYLAAALSDEPYRYVPVPPGKDAPPRLASHEHCTGCTACLNICPRSAISMARDREGFSYPHIDPAACIHCGRCTTVCPALETRETEGAPAVYAAWNRDDDIRQDSSSGGVFTALAEYVLEEGGVVFGAAMDGKQRLVHTACFRKEDLWRLRGAKYVQSDLQETFHLVQWVLEKRKVLFTGTPCQVDGLYHFLGGRPEGLITCDLVCHGVPSPGVWEDMVSAWQDEKLLELRSVRFRDKATGWKDSRMTLVYENGAEDSRPLYSTEYGRAFGRNLFLRPCCHHCPYANLNRPGDFTLGDLWGLRPDDFPREQVKGVSLLLVNTPHGSHIFDRLPLERHPFPVERAVAGNPNLSAPTPRPAERAAFFAAYELEPFSEVRKRFLTVPPLPVRLAKKAVPPQLKAVLRGK